MLVAFVVAVLTGVAGIDIRATSGLHTSGDEPQYLLTALSLYEDGNLDIAGELADGRWRAYNNQGNPPVQSAPRESGAHISPHDPLLAVLLAVPMGLGGFVAAKATMAVLAGCAAALTVWVAVRRLQVPVAAASVVVAVGFASPPLGIYANQVYPEIPAALAALAAFAALTGRWGRGGSATFAVALVALPWLSVKYAPVAVVLAVAGLARLWQVRGRPAAAALAGVLTVAGALYLMLHQIIWGGWTAYATAGNFAESGEFAVIGEDPDYLARIERLTALMVDRPWGIGLWQPGWLLALPAVVALTVVAVRRRRDGAVALVATATVGWATAALIAIRMDGHWSPGRQIVVVLPLLLLAIAWWLAQVRGLALRVLAWLPAAVLGALGVISMVALLRDGRAGEITWISSFAEVDDPLLAAREALYVPFHSAESDPPLAGYLAWVWVFGCSAALAAWGASRRRAADAP